MPTIKDIAKAAGVSHGTVSNVLNKRGNVSYEKIKLVEETAVAMGYAIDEKASLLRREPPKPWRCSCLPCPRRAMRISTPESCGARNGTATACACF